MGFRAPGKRFRQPELSFYNARNPVHRPRAMIRSLCILLVCVVSALAQPNEFRKSLCRVNNTAQEFNYRVPWLPGAMSGGSGTGWVVAKDRIMTNAHVVSNARLLTVEK